MPWDILESLIATGFFIPPLTFPCSHFLDGGGKQERLKEEGGLKKNKTKNKQKKKERKKSFFSFFVKKLALHSFEFSSSYYLECSFDGGFCLESLLQDDKGSSVGNETSPSGNDYAASGCCQKSEGASVQEEGDEER